MQSTKFRPGRVREAGSLEMTASTNRALTRSTLTEIERSHQYDSIFAQDNEKPRVNSIKPSSQQTKKSAKSSDSYADYDLDRIDVERNEDEVESQPREPISRRQQQQQRNKQKNDDVNNKPTRRIQENEETTSEEEREEPSKSSSRHHREKSSSKNSHRSNTELDQSPKKTPLKEKQEQEQQPSETKPKKFTTKNNPFIANSKSSNLPAVKSLKKANNSENEDSENESSLEDAEADDDGADLQIRPDSTNISSSILPRNDFDLNFFRDQNDVDFLTRQAPENVLIRCEILVHPNKFSINDFELFLEDSPRDSPLLSTSSKRSMSGVHLNISANMLDPAVRVYRQKKLGKLRSDLGRKAFQLHEILNPNQMNVQRFELYYKKQSITNPLPKEFELFLRSNPSSDSGSQYSYRFISKAPIFDKEKRTFKLDFKGRAKKASANNMQLVDPDRVDQVLWQLGKVQKNHYILDFSYPFSLFIAFSVALSCLTRK